MARDIAGLAGVGGVISPGWTPPKPKTVAAPVAKPYVPQAQTPQTAAPAASVALPPPPAAPSLDSMGPAPVVEPKPSANPASMAGLDAAMGGGGGEGVGFIGTPAPGLRMLGRRTYPQDSMSLAAVAGSIY